MTYKGYYAIKPKQPNNEQPHKYFQQYSSVEESKFILHHCNSSFGQTSSNKFQLSILEASLITKHKPELCIYKQFYTTLFLTTPLDHEKEAFLPAPTHLVSSIFFRSVSLLLPGFFDVYYFMFTSSGMNLIATDIIL